MPRHHTRGYYSPGSGHPTSNPVTNVPEEPVALDELQALLSRNTDLEGFQTSIDYWSQGDLLALIELANAELVRQVNAEQPNSSSESQ